MRDWIDYMRYLQSSDWRKRRKRLIKEACGCCQRCGRERKALQVHHITYERLGCELDTDLMVVCPACHKVLEREKTVLGGGQ
jgi:5-methylcytosine-specific restriction endonuclease McrA